MRRRPGIAGLQRDVQAREQFRATGQEVRAATVQQMQEQLALFRSKLEEFAHKHKSDIRKDPVFRAQFHAMCANIGVDPLASNKGMWAELLGFGDFYYELGVQVLEACWASRPHDGGLLELRAVRTAVIKRRGRLADAVSEDDIVRAVKSLKVLGGGLDLVTVGARTYIRSVPVELNTDVNRVLELAEGRGCISQPELLQRAGWQAERADQCLQQLLRDGMALIDDGAPDGVRLYWFPAVSSSGGSAGGGAGTGHSLGS